MRIVKVGGRAQGDASLAGAIVRAWNSAPGNLCVVHGGGDEISALQKKLGLDPVMKGGRRFTTADDLAIVRMVLSGLANKRLVSALVREGVLAVGISGEDGKLLCAEPRDAGTFGLVGATPEVKPELLHALLKVNNLPVISPVSACADSSLSEALNVNGDDAAAAIAIAMNADELMFVSDVAGVRDESGAWLQEIDTAHARELMERGTAAGGMAAKLESALFAIEGGVLTVRIGAIDMLDDQDAGTLIRSGTGVVR